MKELRGPRRERGRRTDIRVVAIIFRIGVPVARSGTFGLLSLTTRSCCAHDQYTNNKGNARPHPHALHFYMEFIKKGVHNDQGLAPHLAPLVPLCPASSLDRV